MVLEKAHWSCLWQIMGVRLQDRHSIEHVLNVCHSQPLELIVMKRVFRWLGHVMRMSDERYPKMVYDCEIGIEGATRPQGRPKMAHRHMYARMLEKAGVANPDVWLARMHEDAQDRVNWRQMVDEFAFVPKPSVPAPRHCERIAAMGRH